MEQFLIGSVFYIFAAAMILFALGVVLFRNPVYSVMSLIVVFFNAAALFVLIGAEFIAMNLVIVYVGAVAVLFLFVVMMLDIKLSEFRQGFYKNLPFASVIFAVLLFDLFIVLSKSYVKAESSNFFNVPHIESSISNTHQIGMVLYTDHMIHFQIAGFILLVAMIGAILLVLMPRNNNIKRQDACKQFERNKQNSLKVVKVKIGEGVDAVTK